MNKKKLSTVQDVAKHAQVSAMSVSRFFSNKDLLSDSAFKKIKKSIEELNYIPNRAASNLARNTSNTIGIILPTLRVGVFRSILDGISQAMTDTDLNFVIAISNYDYERELQLVKNFISSRVKGIVLTGVHSPKKTLNLLKHHNMFHLCIADADTPKDFEGIAIGYSHYDGGYTLGKYMTKKGYKKLAYSTLKLHKNDMRNINRYHGFKQAVQDYGAKLVNTIELEGWISYKNGAYATSLIDLTKIDGIMFGTDELAVGAILKWQGLGVKVPKDIAVCGYHGSEIGQILTPSLSTIKIAWLNLGKQIVQKIIELSKKSEDFPTEIIKLKGKLIQGQSC